MDHQTVICRLKKVSTHSRPKAAGITSSNTVINKQCFNTQPPEGGWVYGLMNPPKFYCFNTQPPEGGWRAKNQPNPDTGSFNTQPPEGGWMPLLAGLIPLLGFNTQPPEGGWLHPYHLKSLIKMFQHTAARRRLVQP